MLFQARVDILKIHSRKMNLTRGINLRKVAEKMTGASGAESKGPGLTFLISCKCLVSHFLGLVRKHVCYLCVLFCETGWADFHENCTENNF